MLNLVELQKYYSNLESLKPAEFFNKNILGDSVAAKRIEAILHGRCNSIIVEKNYYDQNYIDSYSKFYSRSFKNYRRDSTRFHFFASPDISTKEIIKGLSYFENDSNDDNENFFKFFGSSYLGYSVLNHCVPPIIGKTYIKPPGLPDIYFLCGGTKKANLSGIPLEIRSSPFIQQDDRVSTCATSALWMSAAAMSQRFNLNCFSPTRITEEAGKNVLPKGRPFPSPGLNIEQMTWALMSMGYEPISYETNDFSTASNAKKLIYSYVESQIPVVLGILLKNGLHAIAVVGHSYSTNVPPSLSHVKNTVYQYLMSSEWVPNFIIHDDQRGPYLQLKLKDRRPTKRFPGNVSISISSEPNFTNATNGALFAMIVPLPKNIYLRGDEAEVKANYILNLTSYVYHELTKNNLENKSLVLRTYLMLSNDFKETLYLRKRIPPHLVAIYQGRLFPKHIWVTEISTVDYKNSSNPNNRLVLGEIITDPTSSPNDIDFITAHVSGLFFSMGPDEKDVYDALIKSPVILVDNFKPYLSFERCI